MKNQSESIMQLENETTWIKLFFVCFLVFPYEFCVLSFFILLINFLLFLEWIEEPEKMYNKLVTSYLSNCKLSFPILYVILYLYPKHGIFQLF